MPSTHSASIAFMGVYLASVFLTPDSSSYSNYDNNYYNYSPSSLSSSSSTQRALYAFCAIAFASAVCWSRVKLGHHTPAQVLVGCSLGALTALVASKLWTGDGHSGGVGISGGLRLPAARLEAAIEDACWIALEAWQERDWRTLKRTLLETDWKAVVTTPR
jgi:dolichyldiphosphatase